MDKRSLEFVREILKMECPERRFVEPGSIGNMTASIRSATLYTGQSGEIKPVEFINTDVWGIEHALRWCHNLQNTWARSDSGLCKGGDDGIGCVHCAIRQRCSHFYNREFVLGIRDME